MNLTKDEWYQMENRYACYLKILKPKDIVPMKSLLLDEKDDYYVYFVACCFIFGLLNIVVNSLLIFALVKERGGRKMSFSDKLFIYLSCTDLTTGCVLIPLKINEQLNGQSCLYKSVLAGLFAYVSLADSSILFIISIIRLFTIRDPLNSQHHHKRAWIMIGIQIFTSFLIGACFFCTFYYGEGLEHFQLVAIVGNVASSSVCIAIIICVLMSLFTLRKYKQSNSSVFSHQQMANHKKSVSSLLLIGLTMLIFVLVQTSMFLDMHLKLKDLVTIINTFKSTQHFVDALYLICHTNTITNSIVIVVRSKKLRRHFLGICR